MRPGTRALSIARAQTSRCPRRSKESAARALRGAAAGAAGLCCLALLAATRGGHSARPNLLLITVDTLRPDSLGWVAGKNLTPSIDTLAREGVRFPAAVSPAPLTLPSHISLMSGLLPRRHGVRDNGQVLDPKTATLAKALHANKYTTAAFVSGYPLRRLFGLDAGFDEYDDRLPVGSEGWIERHASDTTAAAIGWAVRARPPWFLWVHYYDPHDPYTPPPAFIRPGPRGAYDGEVASVDSAIGRLLRGLPPAPASGRITVFAGDHGESLGEHGESGHGFFLYDATVLVPLIFHAPGRLAARESRAAARLIDVAPTLLDLAGLPPLGRTDGRTLTPELAGREGDVGPAYVETQQPWTAYGWSPLSAIRESEWKLVQAPRPELYDLRKDPLERENVFAQNRERAGLLARALQKFEAGPASDSRRTADPEAMARLRSLGYVGAGSSGAPSLRNLADPKDRLAERSALLQGEDLLRQGKFDASIAVFAGVLGRDPGNRFALLRSGVAYLKKGDLAAAVLRLEEAVRLDSEQAESQFALADALTRSGQFRRAVPHWMEAARLQPRRVAAWSNLGTALGGEGKLAEAMTAFRRAVEIDPKDPLLLANLAFAELGLKKEDAALEHLRNAASAMPPDRFLYAGTLGLLHLKKGEPGEAAKWLGRSRPGEVDYAQARFELALIELYGGDKVGARRNLDAALSADPALRSRAQGNPALASLLK